MKITKKNNYRKFDSCLSCKFMVDTDGYECIDPYCNYDNTYDEDLQWKHDKSNEEWDIVANFEEDHKVDFNGICDLWRERIE